MASSQFKVSRRIGENVWTHKKITPKQISVLWKLKRKANRKLSDFATQLHHTTKLSIFYGHLPIRKIQHSRTYNYLNKQKSLLLNLESRLDVILVRANLCSTLYTARHFISHGYFCVNFQTVTLPAFSVSSGDIISISPDFVQGVYGAPLEVSHEQAPTQRQDGVARIDTSIAQRYAVSRSDTASMQSMKRQFCGRRFATLRAIIRQNLNQNRVLRTKSYHLEVNYKTFNVVMLYEPSKIHFPYSIELDLV